MSKLPGTPTPRGAAAQTRQHPLMALRDEMDELLSRFLGSSDDGWFSGRSAPLLDMWETDTAIELAMDLPGVNPADVDIHLAGNTLTIRGERKSESDDKGRVYHRVERRKGEFGRSVTLPCDVVDDQVSAAYRDGVLTIGLPKCKEARSRKIEITH